MLIQLLEEWIPKFIQNIQGWLQKHSKTNSEVCIDPNMLRIICRMFQPLAAPFISVTPPFYIWPVVLSLATLSYGMSRGWTAQLYAVYKSAQLGMAYRANRPLAAWLASWCLDPFESDPTSPFHFIQ